MHEIPLGRITSKKQRPGVPLTGVPVTFKLNDITISQQHGSSSQRRHRNGMMIASAVSLAVFYRHAICLHATIAWIIFDSLEFLVVLLISL
jgi:hypothetical protein